MKKRIMIAALAVAAVFALSACKQDEQPDDPVTPDNTDQNQQTQTDDGSDNEKQDIDYLSDLSTERYDGYEFRILIRKDKITDQYFEEPPEDIVDDAIYKRNKLVEEMYGITITATESSSNDYEIDALNSILAGDDAYDVIFPHSRAAFTYAVQGAVYNINDIEAIHTEKPWWSQDIIDSCDVNGHLYVLDGDISMHRLSFAMCMYFNKRIFDELGFDYPYEAVLDGDWTFDEFAYYAKKGGSDLNGDGVMDPETDQYGFYCQEWGAPIEILYTGGQKIYDKNEEGVLELTLYSNKTVEIFDEFFSLMDNEACFLHLTNDPKNYDGPNLFSEGRAMIAGDNLGSAKGFRNMDDDFGIIPYPKFDEDDEYATIVNGHAHLLVIPTTVEDVERTGSIIEALCAIGSRDVVPAFYDVSLKTKYARDEESEAMMDIIKDSVVYDIGYVAGGVGGLSSVGRELARSTTHDFASYYAAQESSAQIALEEFNESYGGIEAD